MSFSNPIQAKEITLKVNGKQVKTDTAPEIKNGRTFIPLRAMFEAIGMEVEWTADDQTARAYNQKEDLYVGLTVGLVSSTVGNRNKIMEEPAYISNNRVMVPVRFIGESLGYEVNWNSSTKEINMAKEDRGLESDDGITVLINGKRSNISNYARFYDGGDNYIYENVILAPLELLAQELNPYADVEIKDGMVTLYTNFEIFSGRENTYILSGYNRHASPEAVSRMQYFIGDTYLMDVIHIADILCYNYEYDVENKVLYLDRKAVGTDANINMKIIEVENEIDFKEKMYDIYMTHEEAIDIIALKFNRTLTRRDLERDPEKGSVYDNIFGEFDYAKIDDFGDYKTSFDMSNYVDFARNSEYVKHGIYYSYTYQDKPVRPIINKEAKKIVNKLINNSMSDQTKVEILNKYFADNVSYNYQAAATVLEERDPIYNSAYSSLVLGTSVCQGYADALHATLYHAGIESKVVVGMGEDEKHAWVKVLLDGEWLHVDPTWTSTSKTNDYVLKTDSQMRATHKWE